MVMAAVRSPYSQNPTGLVPQFNGTPVSTPEIGFTPGNGASSVRAFDNIEGRKGYSGLYQFAISPEERTLFVVRADPVSADFQ
jgi:porin